MQNTPLPASETPPSPTLRMIRLLGPGRLPPQTLVRAFGEIPRRFPHFCCGGGGLYSGFSPFSLNNRVIGTFAVMGTSLALLRYSACCAIDGHMLTALVWRYTNLAQRLEMDGLDEDVDYDVDDDVEDALLRWTIVNRTKYCR